jgi:hypothetical protein
MGHRSISLRLIGYWRDEDGPDEDEPQWPDPAAMIDDTMPAQTRDLVVDYLETGRSMPWACAGFSRCRICGKPNGTGELTDGIFVWPEGLAHYVAEHSVRLPDEFISLVEAWAEYRPWDIDHQWWLDQTASRG